MDFIGYYVTIDSIIDSPNIQYFTIWIEIKPQYFI